MTRARRSFAVARYLYAQIFLRRPLMLLGLLPAAFMCSTPNLFSMLACSVMLAALPRVALAVTPAHLPIDRRAVLSWGLLPVGLVLVASLAVSLSERPNGTFASFRYVSSHPFHVALGEPRGAPRVHFDSRLWQLGGAQPRYADLPGRGRIAMERLHVFGPIYAHNPYTVPEGASSELAAQQVHRALTACCDLKLSLGQVRAHIAHPGPDSTVSLEHGAAESERAHWGMVLLRYWLVTLMILAWVAVVLRLHPSAKRAQRRGTPIPVKIGGVGFVAALFTGFLASASSAPLLPLQVAVGTLSRLLVRFPWAGSGLGLALLSGAAYLLLRRAQRLELPQVINQDTI